jgi:hypothetical protein
MANAVAVKVVKQGIEIINAELTLAQQRRILAAWKALDKAGVKIA